MIITPVVLPAGTMLGLCWDYVGIMLGLCWDYVVDMLVSMLSYA